jgi:hypothetical protein
MSRFFLECFRIYKYYFWIFKKSGLHVALVKKNYRVDIRWKLLK